MLAFRQQHLKKPSTGSTNPLAWTIQGIVEVHRKFPALLGVPHGEVSASSQYKTIIMNHD